MPELLRLDRQVSAGPDGVRYLGVDPNDGAPVQVERLFLAQRVSGRWQELHHRILVASHLQRPGVLQLRGYQGDGDDPYLVTAAPKRTLTDALLEGIEWERAVQYLGTLAQVMADAHRYGLVHRRLCPSRIALDADDELAVSIYGTRTGSMRALDDLDHACFDRDNPGPEGDVYSLAALAVALLTGEALEEELPSSISNSSTRLEALLEEMLAQDPAARPTMSEVASRLVRSESTTVVSRRGDKVQAAPKSLRATDRVGRYELEELLGEGGMGKVFRAKDIGSGGVVALKVLHDRWVSDEEALGRFYREARMLAELDNPHIARFIEANEDAGTHFLAMEFVEGESLEDRLRRGGPLDEVSALGIVRDIATALADVHELGAVHRDVKPANILLVEHTGQRYVAKLCDFGVARSVEPTPDGEELTTAGMAVGTPHYMSPEQCVGQGVGPATDVYALGITLYKTLAGKVPFTAADPRSIVFKHISEPVPDVREVAPEVSESTKLLIDAMLVKNQDDRIADAGALLDQLEETRGTDGANIGDHPAMPDDSGVQHYDFVWDLASAPEELWPHVSNTERLNRAIGLDAIQYTREVQQNDVATYGQVRVSGMLLDWREHAYEWVAPSRMGILRDFSAGPFHWMRSSVQLEPAGEGTRLHHRIDVLPRGVIGRAATAMEVGFKAKRNLEAVYQRIDAYCRAEKDAPEDPFEQRQVLERVRAQRVVGVREELVRQGLPSEVVDVLCRYVGEASPQDAARIRPRALARKRGVDEQLLLHCCLHAAHEGLLQMLWDLICPRCQIPANIVDTLSELRDHGHCEACALDFELDFGSSVEVIFRAHPAIRDSELGTYCIGGPGHTPHVVAQVRLRSGERFVADLSLPEGAYRVAGRRLEPTWDFTVTEEGTLRHWEVDLGRGLDAREERALGGPTQRIILNNALDREVVARIEKRSGRAEAVTAAEVSCLPAFRQLFPREVMAPGQLIGVGRVNLLLVELAMPWQNRDETEVFAELTALKEIASQVAEDHGGSVVKLQGDGVLMTFDEPLAAIRTGEALLSQDEGKSLCAAAHCGPVMATTINDRLDYFGRVVRELDTLGRAADPGQFAVAESLHADPGAAAMLAPQLSDAPVVNAHGVVAVLLSPEPVSSRRA